LRGRRHNVVLGYLSAGDALGIAAAAAGLLVTALGLSQFVGVHRVYGVLAERVVKGRDGRG
jgi:hypothetical protein